MQFEYYGWDDGTSLYHYGILGQKWGIRRYQNPDGTLTEEGKKRYRNTIARARNKAEKRIPEINKMRDAVRKDDAVRKQQEESLNTQWDAFIKKHPDLKKDFGHWTQIDDPDFAEYILDNKYGISGSASKKFRNELESYSKHLYSGSDSSAGNRFMKDADKLEARVNDILARTKKKNLTVDDIKEIEKFLNEEFRIGNVLIKNL